LDTGSTAVLTPALWRRRWYTVPARQHRLRQPVISIGNLSHGGRGKTPVVARVARLLIEAGERPAILSRGYGRRDWADGVVVVSDGRHLLADVGRGGDEPLMLARELPGACVLVSEQRALAGALAERVLGATIHLLDDGFQHLALARDIDLVLVSPEDLHARAVPFGPLREPVAALADADAIIVDGASNAEVRNSKFEVRAPASFVLRRELRDPVPLEPQQGWEAADRRVLAVAGIARPERFAAALEARGWTVVDRLTFPDHHPYSVDDVGRIAAAASRARVPVLTTAKDAIRLLPLRPLRFAAASVPLEASVEPADAFRAWLFERLSIRTSAQWPLPRLDDRSGRAGQTSES
jgi:tetraacyldisaccharide 4'-kinase